MKTEQLLSKLHSDVEAVVNTTENELKKLSDKDLNWKAGDSWSILECIEHLNRYNAYYLTAIENAIATASKSNEGMIRYTWIGMKSINMMHPTNLKKQKTFKKMNPASSTLDRSVLDKFLADQKRLNKCLDNVGHVNINSKSVPVEFFKLLNMRIGEAIEFVTVHQQRHFLQIERILQLKNHPHPTLAV